MASFIKIILIFLLLQTLDLKSVSGKPESKTYFDVLRDFMEKTPSLNDSNFVNGDRQDQDTFSLLKIFHNINTFFLENLDRPFNVRNASIFSMNDGPFSMFGKHGSNETRLLEASKCVNDTGRLIIGLLNKEMWAIQFYDATGKPGPSLTQARLNFVGNYDQCTSVSVPSELPPNGLKASGFHGGYFQISLKSPAIPIPIQVGTCLPDTCSEKDIASICTEMINAANSSLSLKSVHYLTNATEVTTATILAIVVSCVIGLMMILGTMYDLLYVQFPLRYRGCVHTYSANVHPQDMSKSNGNHVKVDDGDSNDDRNKTKTNSLAKQNNPSKNVAKNIILAFSVYSNAKKILNVSRAPSSIDSIHGIRFLSTSWVVLGHTFFFGRSYGVNFVTEFPEFLQRWTFDTIINALVSVDTFFTLSGLLTSYTTIEQIWKKGLKLNWPLFYFHRFWRLTPPYMLSILLYLGFQQYFIKGPLRNYEQPTDKAACEKNWWTNLLYVNNLVDTNHMCFGHSWYLANDMQFFIVSPLMIVPFYFNRFAGLCSCIAFLLASWIATAVSSILEEWPTTTLGFIGMKSKMPDGMGNKFTNHYYLVPWCRIGPFIVGIMAGYVLAVHKGRKLHIKWWIVVLGWITATVSALAVLYGIHGDIGGENRSSVAAAALYNSVGRSVWGACVSWVIIACTAGYGGPVNTLLSWSPFVALGRLSYVEYLIHIPIILIFYQNLDQLFYMNETTMSVYFLGLLTVSNLMAFVIMLGLESPMIGLERAILKK